MENAKYLSAILATALIVSQPASAMTMNSSMSNFGSVSDYADYDYDQVVTGASSDGDESDDGDESENGDTVISDSQVRKGTYTVNGGLTVEGVLYVFGNLDVNGDLTVEKNAKVRVTGKISVNGSLVNNGGSVYGGKWDMNGSREGKARKFDSLLTELDPLLSVNLMGEEREGILQDILDSKGIVRVSRLQDFLDSLEKDIGEDDLAAYEKIKKRLVLALERKIKQQGGLKDAQLDLFQKKLESMTTEKLQTFLDRVEKLQKATKKKRLSFQLAQLRELVEEVLEAREVSLDEPVVEVPSSSEPSSSESGTSTGSTSESSASGSTSTASGSASSESATGSTSTAQ